LPRNVFLSKYLTALLAGTAGEAKSTLFALLITTVRPLLAQEPRPGKLAREKYLIVTERVRLELA
ncbi:MAG: hypothetical protein QXJ97_13545, partial [Desulfurococcaceae archaeon]